MNSFVSPKMERRKERKTKTRRRGEEEEECCHPKMKREERLVG